MACTLSTTATGRDDGYYKYDCYNHWGESGTANATHGVRPWLNSTGIHSGEGFYRAFSDSFKEVVLTTNVPNKEWEKGSAYKTQDYVFLPSTSELGDAEHNNTYQIGSVYPYFAAASDEDRIAVMVGDYWRKLVEKVEPGFLDELGVPGNSWWYFTRSPDSLFGDRVRRVSSAGEFEHDLAYYSILGVRPALNLISGILVSEIK